MTVISPIFEDAITTVYRGDARALLPLLLDAIPDACVVSDPPYGVAFRSDMDGRWKGVRIAGDETTELLDWVAAVAAPRPTILFGSPKRPRPQRDDYRSTLIWDKGGHVGMGDLRFPWRPNYEHVFVYGTGFAGRRTTSVLRHNAIAFGRNVHPTEKPVALMEELVGKCPPGVILDPFAGSGSTLVAARNRGRRAIGIELDPGHCRTILRRLEPATEADQEVAA